MKNLTFSDYCDHFCYLNLARAIDAYLSTTFTWNRNSKFWISLANQIVTFVLCFSYSGLSVVGVVWMEQLQRGLWKRNKNQSQVNTAIHSRSITKWTSLLRQGNSNSFYLGQLHVLFFLVLTSKTSCRIIASKREAKLFVLAYMGSSLMAVDGEEVIHWFWNCIS